MNDNRWHMITIVVYKKTITVYLDGINRTTKTSKISLPILAEGIIIGQDQDSVLGKFESKQRYRGAMDDISIWNRILSANEVRELFEDSKP